MKVLFPIVGELLVEVGILLFGDFFSLLHPEGLVLVDLLELSVDLLDLALLLLLLVLLLRDLSFLRLLFSILLLIIADLLFGGLLDLEFDGESDEF